MSRQGLLGERDPRGFDEVFKRSLVLGPVVGTLVGIALTLPDLVATVPDDDPMTMSPAVGFVVSGLAFAGVGTICAMAAFLPWSLTAQLPTLVRYLVAALGAAFAVGFLDVGAYDPSWFAVRVAGAAAGSALLLAPTITSRRARKQILIESDQSPGPTARSASRPS